MYKLVAIDDDGLASLENESIELIAVDFGILEAVDWISLDYKEQENAILISWEYPENERINFQLYRAIDGKPFKHYETILAEDREFNDDAVRKGEKYEYTIKVTKENKTESDFSPVKAIEITQ